MSSSISGSSAMTLTTEWWDIPYVWKEWAVKDWNPAKHRLQAMSDETRLRREFTQAASEALQGHNYPYHRVRAWVSIMRPQDGVECAHAHNDPDSMTVVVYLTDGTPLECEGHEYHPKPGFAIYIPDGVYHRVAPNTSDKARIALVARGYGN